MAIEYTYKFTGLDQDSAGNMAVLYFTIEAVDTDTQVTASRSGRVNASVDPNNNDISILDYNVLLSWFNTYAPADFYRSSLASEIQEKIRFQSPSFVSITPNDLGETLTGQLNQPVQSFLLDNNTNVSPAFVYLVNKVSHAGSEYVIESGNTLVIDLAEKGNISFHSGGEMTYTPATDYYGEVGDFIYSVTNGYEETQSTLRITDIIVQVVAQDATFTGNYNATVNGNILANAAPGIGTTGQDRVISQVVINNVQYTVPTTTTDLNFDTDEGNWIFNANGNFQFNPVTDYVGPVPSVEFTVQIGNGTDTGILTITDIVAP